MASEDKKRKDPSEINFNVYVGSETGFLKGICFGQETPVLKELSDYNQTEKPVPIKTLSWTDPSSPKDLLVGLLDRTVKVYNTKLRAFTQGTRIELEDGHGTLDESPLVSLSQLDEKYLVGLQNGRVSYWDPSLKKSVTEFQSGSHLSCLKSCPGDLSIFATGGKENDLKIWKLDSSEGPLWKARNVPHVLELRIPVWVQDLTFLPQTTDLVAIVSRHGHLRLYDTKLDNRSRPVINMEFSDHPVMSIAPTRNDRQVIVGSSQGKVGLVDVRNYGKERVVHLFEGFNGSVRSIVTDENGPYFVSCGLDRYLYLHHLNEKRPVKKLYLKSRLTAAAITKDFLAELVASGEDVQTAWHNIDMNVLPGLPSIEGSAVAAAPPAKRIRKTIITV